MSYKKHTPDSYRRVPGAKYIIPFLVGLIVALFIWMDWLFSQAVGDIKDDFNFALTVLLIEIRLLK